MSNIYTTEPPTKGKVVLHTSAGDLDIELWPKEAPLAVRNFVQLCLEGYYDGTLFHRLIKDYLVQGGDPTGTGKGGTPIYGAAFKDEFHSRLKFSHRGLLACANQNQPHTNGAQFFFTLGAADWLDKKNTIFGKVTGDSIYNLMQMGDLEVDDQDQPLNPLVLREAEVLWNPFEDIVPRVDRQAAQAAVQAKKAEADAAKKKKGGREGAASKNLALLSFGEEAEEEEQLLATAAVPSKIRSAHDVLTDGRLAKEVAAEVEEAVLAAENAAKKARTDGAVARARSVLQAAAGKAGVVATHPVAADDGVGDADSLPDKAPDDFGLAMRSRINAARQRMGDAGTSGKASAAAPAGTAPSVPPAAESYGDEDDLDYGEDDAEQRKGRGAAASTTSKDFRQQRRDELEALRTEGGDKKSYGRVVVSEEVTDADLLKPWQVNREKYKQRKRLIGDREKDTLSKLAKFTAALRTQPSQTSEESAQAETSGSAAPDTGLGKGGYAGKVRSDLDHKTYLPSAWRVDDYLAATDGADDSLAQLRAHQLRFSAAGPDAKDAMTRTETIDDYVVFDPLLEKGKGKFSKTAAKEKKSQSEWRQQHSTRPTD